MSYIGTTYRTLVSDMSVQCPQGPIRNSGERACVLQLYCQIRPCTSDKILFFRNNIYILKNKQKMSAYMIQHSVVDTPSKMSFCVKQITVVERLGGGRMPVIEIENGVTFPSINYITVASDHVL